MKITKLSVIVFIFLLFVSVMPPILGSNGSQINQEDQITGLVPDQSTNPTDFGDSFINASVSDVQRNVTVKIDAKVTLEDEFTLQVLGNTTQIATLNYTIPSVFANHLHEIKFYSQFDDDLGLISPNNSRDFEVYYGSEATTFSIDIRQNGFAANDTLDGVFFKTRLTTYGNVDITGEGTGQKGIFQSPILPMFPNFEVNDAMIGLAIEGTVDDFAFPEMEKFENRFGDQMPAYQGTPDVLTYTNMSRQPFSYEEGLQETDVVEVIFTSQTPASQGAETGDLTAVVPSVIETANRTVRFDPWGKVYVREEISILHLGGERNITGQIFANIHQIPGITFVVDSDATITDVYDELGSLHLGPQLREDDTNYPKTTDSGVEGKQALQVAFRNPIYGGNSYELTFEYEYNASEVISIENNRYTMNTTLFSDYNTTIQDLTLRYQFPAGTVYQGNTYQANSRFIDYSVQSAIDRNPLSAFKHYELVINAEDVSYTDNVGFEIMFTYNGMGHLQYFASFMYITIVILALAYGLSNISYRPSKAIEIEKAQTPVDEMDAFFNLFSEKAGAEKRLADLRRQRLKGKLSKKDYDGKVKSIRRRLRDLNPELEKAANKLSAKGGRYENYVKRVMLASQRQSDIRRNAREAKKAYERGSIPKNIYQLRIKEFNEDLKKQETTINKTLTEMVELIQKYTQ